MELALSIFIVAQLFTICQADLWHWISHSDQYRAPRVVSPLPAAVQWLNNAISRYGNLVGLDLIWSMYANIPHYNWRFIFKAEYADGSSVVLPLPRQSPRTFWQRQLFDFKEGKFHHLISVNLTAKQAYAQYLCRTYPMHRFAPIRAIVWENHWERILTPGEAATRGTHFGATQVDALHRIACESPVGG